MPYILDARSFDETDVLLLKHFVDFKAPSVKARQAEAQPCQKLCTPRTTIKDAVYGDSLLLEQSSAAPTVVAAPRFVAGHFFCFNSDEVIELRDCEEADGPRMPSKCAKQTTKLTEESSQLRVNPIKEVVYGHLADTLTEAATVTLSEQKHMATSEQAHFKKIIHPVLEVQQAAPVVVPCGFAKSAKVSWKEQMFQGIDVF
jgi:hypothetical protein